MLQKKSSSDRKSNLTPLPPTKHSSFLAIGCYHFTGYVFYITYFPALLRTQALWQEGYTVLTDVLFHGRHSADSSGLKPQCCPFGLCLPWGDDFQGLAKCSSRHHHSCIFTQLISNKMRAYLCHCWTYSRPDEFFLFVMFADLVYVGLYCWCMQACAPRDGVYWGQKILRN